MGDINNVVELAKTNQQESYKAALEFLRLAIKAIFILNGGALVAVLPLISYVYKTGDCQSASIIHSICSASLFFVFGLIFAAFTVGFAFLAQEKMTHSNSEEILGNEPGARSLRQQNGMYRNVGLVSYWISIGLFIAGTWLTYHAFLTSI